VNVNTKYFNHKNGQIAYDDSGTGPLVVCVPSMGDLRREYRFLRPLMVDAGYRVVTMDVRGHGETSTGWDDFSVAGVGEDILALVRELKAGPAIVIGTSMGAGAAIWAAVESPELVRGMILVDPFVDGEGNRFLALLFRLMFARPWGPSMWVKYYQTLYPTRKPADFAEYASTLRANLTERGRHESLLRMLRASKKASGERIPRLNTPALVLMGSKDPDFKNPAQEAKRVADMVCSESVMIENAGHYPHAEFPEETARHMISFMDTLGKK
jgi:pimeloyl-ACP methyl ester carboxylesterase